MRLPADIERALDYLKQLGVSESDAAPPIYRLAWRAGLRPLPPLFAPFFTTAAIQVLSSATLSFVASLMFKVLLSWHGQTVILLTALGAALGLVNAIWFKLKASKFRVPSWPHFVCTSGGT